jgi:cellulose synthase (UDP-forming)
METPHGWPDLAADEHSAIFYPGRRGSMSGRESSAAGAVLWGVLALPAIVVLGVLISLSLPWKEQAIFGGGAVGVAILLNAVSQARIVTLALMAISVFSTLRYGYWRVTQTWDGITSAGHLHQWDTLLVLLLLFAEFYAFATLVLGYFQVLQPLRRPPLPLTGRRENWPTVDVFIPTYNEPLSVVRATVLGALALDYPAEKYRVFVLDDGRRAEFARFAAQVGAGYIARDNNRHAKAGNINNALSRTRGEYVAIFDSDHIPTRSFLEMTLGWFERDPSLAMVQTPHHFYSPDPFERNLGQFRRIPNEGELFHRLVQDGNDFWNASFFCGSCAVLRRKALADIGGMAVETVTEDAHTALRMQRRGWNTAYINVPQAAGLATESLAAHIGQRIRWARGMVQILRMENPLFASGLSWSQRLCYFNATTHFLFALPRLIFLLIPLVYLLFGVVNIYGYSLAVFAYALPHILLSNLTNSRIQGRYRFSFWNEIYEAVLAPYILLPTLLALVNPRLGKFNVTSKGGIVRRSYFDRRIAWPFLLLLALNGIGLGMAIRRFVHDPLHHDTVLMNTVWTVYNLAILSVAASVAWEKKQRRSQVRVQVHLPIVLAGEDGRPIAGLATQLSTRGAMVRVAQRLYARRGTPVRIVLDGTPARSEILARVVDCSNRRLHLFFPELSLAQEKYLVYQIYSRPAAWVGWNRSRPLDRPLRSLGQVLWLALRGLAVIAAGLFTSRPSAPRKRLGAQEKRGESPAAASLALVCLVLISVGAHAQVNPPAPQANPSAGGPAVSSRAATPVASFQDSYDLGSLAARGAIGLRGAGSSQNFFLDMPLTKIIGSSSLDLSYSAPLLHPGESWLEIWLNGTQVGSLPLVPGRQRTEVPLPADLLTSNNTLTFQLQGSCSACRNRLWLTIDPSSQLHLSGSRLPLGNDLALLPVPFFDSALQHSWSLPVVFSDIPDQASLAAASIVASWFGIFSDFRGVRFPVTIGDVPQGNAVIFALRSSELARRLTLPSRAGAVITVRDNPGDPFGKLLIIAGDESADLAAGARALVTRDNTQAHTNTVYISKVTVPVRREYEAPRWLDAGRPSPIGTYTTAERLKAKGSGSVNIYFRLPPDLFLAARQSVPLLLKYTYAGVDEGSRAALHVRLNDRDIDSIRLEPASSAVNEQEIVRLPTGRLRPYTNTLTVDFDFGHVGKAGRDRQYAAVGRDSNIDLSDLPHSVVLPRLELFASSGYPFTAWPDLGRSAIVLSQAPDATEYETLLDMMGFFGAQTGAAATRVFLTDAAHVEVARDQDLILLGTPSSQPLLSDWSRSMPVSFAGEWRLGDQEAPSRFLHPEWPFRDRDRDRLANLLSTRPPLDLMVEAFVSPFGPDRSVVAIVPSGEGALAAIAALFTPALDKGPIYGGAAIARNGRFQSYLIGNFAYHSGHLDWFEQSRIFLLEHYLFIPLLVVVVAFMLAAGLEAATEHARARRLAVGRSSFSGWHYDQSH